jgi:ribulose-5-phosphate 4-epimerase/fuculose-1-phosphate aldolase
MSIFNLYKQWTHAVVRMVNAPRQSDADQLRARYLLTPLQRQELFSAAGDAVARGLAHATTGEISLRLNAYGIVISATGANLARLSERDLVFDSIKEPLPLTQAARRLAWHQAMYTATDAGAVLVCQPPHALALANARRLPEADCGAVYAAIGGVQLVEESSLGTHAPTAHALLIPGTGAVVWGTNAYDALVRAEALEHAARVTVVAALLL